MAVFASGKYESILTNDDDQSHVLRTASLYITEDKWGKVKLTAEKLLYVRNTILKGGAGLAAPQIGINLPVFIYAPDRTTENLRIVVNPSYEALGDEIVEGVEACFSVPLQCTKLKRWKKIKVRYQNLEKVWINDVLTDFEAKVFQHEMDHLKGKLIIDHNTAVTTAFTDQHAFEEHMKSVHEEDSKSYRRDRL